MKLNRERNSSQNTTSAKNEKTTINNVRPEKSTTMTRSNHFPIQRFGNSAKYKVAGIVRNVAVAISKIKPVSNVPSNSAGRHETSLYCQQRKTNLNSSEVDKNQNQKAATSEKRLGNIRAVIFFDKGQK